MKQIFSDKINIINRLTLKRSVLLVVLILFISVDGFARLKADFNISSKTVCDGSSLTFTNTSTGTSGSTEYYWQFGAGASPANATGKGPHIVSYTGSGLSIVSLTVRANDGDDQDATVDFITRHSIPDAPEVSVINNCDGTSTLSTTALGLLLWSTGETTSSIIVTASEIFSVTTTVDDCTSLPGSGTAEPKTSPAAPEVIVVDNCDGTSTLSTVATGTLLWSTGETTTSITVTISGIYTVTTTIDGCTSLSGSGTAAPKTIPATPIVTVVDNCNGSSTLSTDAIGVLLWSTAETTSSIIVTIPGIFSVTNTIDACTSLPGSGTAAPKTGTAVPVATVVNNCNGTSTLSTIATGALLWSTGETTSSITVTTSGIYTVTNTIEGCTSLPGSITAAPKTVPSTPVVTVVNNCNGTSTLSTVVAGTLLWSTGETTSSITVTVSGLYTVTATVDGCTSIPGSGTAAPKTIPATPVVTVVNNCNGSSTLSTIAGGALLWSTGQTSSSISVTLPGIYTVTSTIDGCTSLPGSVTAAPKTTLPTPVVTVVDLCNGSSTLSTGAVGALLWSTGETSSSITVTVSGIYTVTTTIDGCTSLPGTGTAAPKTIPATPAVTVVNNCNGSSTLANIAPGASLWSTGETTSSITVTVSGIYTVTTIINGCNSLPGSGTAAPRITPAAPLVEGTIQPTCTVSTGSVQLNGLPSGTWTINPGSITGATISKTITGLVAGTYSFTVTNSEGCTSSVSSAVIINTQPVIPAPPTAGTIIQPTCSLPTGSLELTGLTDSGIWTITRYPGTVVLTGTGISTTISGLQAGTYNFTLANAAGCVSATSANVIINTQPLSPSAPAQTIDCTLGFDKAVVKVTSPLGPGLEYNIDGGAYSSSTSFINQKNGTHVITVRNSSGCITSGVDFSVSCGCSNPPIITLSSSTGSTCGTTPVTVTNNLTTGSATRINLTTNGGGTLSLLSVTVSPFSFTYTPSAGDSGKKITISLITDNPLGFPCAAGTATFTLTVNAMPSAPVVGVVTQMTCKNPISSVILTGLPQAGTWILTNSTTSVSIAGTGITTAITGLAAGVYSFSVTNQEGCLSIPSSNVTINPNPGTPLSPTIGTITAPSCNLATGSVSLNGLPLTGSWTLTRFPGNVTLTGTGTSITISGLSSGMYNYAVTNLAGCISELSMNIVIPAQPSSVTMVITNPPLLCTPRKADLTSPSVTAGSTQGITYAYYTDASATISFPTPYAADNGIYYIRGTNSGGCYDIKPVTVTVNQSPNADAGPDKTLDNVFETVMDAEITRINDTGTWTVLSGTGEFLDVNDAKTSVKRLSMNKNMFMWTVRNGICPASYDTVSIIVRDLKVPTLITPNMDGRNDYFEVNGLESTGKTELVIFDRRGVQVFKSANYDNLWNGVDYNGNPLHDDTYFYSLRTKDGKTINGFIVIRR